MDLRTDKPLDSSGQGTMEAIFREATASILGKNGFRVLNLPADATPREIERQYKQLEMALGLEQTQDARPGFLRPPALSAESVQEARLRLRDAELRLVDEYFWFWSSGPGKDDPALLALAKGDDASATTLWEQPPNSPEEAAIQQHNLAVCYLLAALSREAADGGKNGDALTLCWGKSVQQWVSIFDDRLVHEYLIGRVRKIEDARLTPAFAARLHAAAAAVLLRVHGRLALEAGERGDFAAVERHRKLAGSYGCEEEVLNPALEEAVQPLAERTGHLCEDAKKEAQGNRQASPQIIDKLFEQAKGWLRSLDALAPEQSVARDHAHDEIGLAAQEICGGWIEHAQQFEKACEILTKAKSLVRSEGAKQEMERVLTIWREQAEQWALFGHCWFCQKAAPEIGAARKVNFHKRAGRIGAPPYDEGELLIPRCPACAALHKHHDEQIALRSIVMGVILGLIITSRLSAHGFGAFAAFVVLTFMCIGLAAALNDWVIKTQLPKGQRHADDFKSYPKVVEFLKAGWSLGKKPTS
jgi:hypothetical protein